MVKILGGVLAGVFVGAAVLTIIEKKNPKFFENTKKKITDGLAALKGAFMEGYTQTVKS